MPLCCLVSVSHDLVMLFLIDLPDTGWTIGAGSSGKSRWNLNWAFIGEVPNLEDSVVLVCAIFLFTIKCRPTSSKSATLMPKAMAKTPLSDTVRFLGCTTSRKVDVRTKSHHLSLRMMQLMCSHRICLTTRQQIRETAKTAKIREAEPWHGFFGGANSSFCWCLFKSMWLVCCIHWLFDYESQPIG